MQGITNAPQGGSAGEWTARTSNNDWTDMFEVVNNKIRSKCDVYLYYKSSNNKGVGLYIPKNFESGTVTMYFDLPMVEFLSADRFSVLLHIPIASSNIESTSTNLACKLHGYTVSFDGSTVSFSASTNLGTKNIGKSDFIIYTK